jgi:peptide/nickel transport system permease protein
MNLVRFLVGRAAQSVVSLFGLSVLVFTMSRVLPGDPVRYALGPEATEEMVEAYRQELGLHLPIHEQYFRWVSQASNGYWGESLRTGNNVFADLIVRVGATVELVLVAIFFALLIAIPFGVIAGTNKDRWPDQVSRVFALIGVSIPRFWLAIVLQVIFFAVLAWFPLTGRAPTSFERPPVVTGFMLLDTLIAGDLGKFQTVAHHIVLPAAALGTGTVANVTRLLRSDMIDESRKEYILFARANGVPENLIKYKYMLKNAFTSSLTVIGLTFGALLGGAFFVEVVFAWPGIALYGVNGILYSDLNAIIGIVMFIGTGFIIANTIVDLLYGYLDPRQRLES